MRLRLRLRSGRRTRRAHIDDRPVLAAEISKLENLESRTLLSAVRSGFDANSHARTDDDTAGEVDLGFSVNFFGPTYSSLFVNNNGNVTFGKSLRTYTPFGLITNTATPIIAPFFADVDTRNSASSVMTYGAGTVDGHLAFGVNWRNVGYYNTHADKLNRFQLVLIDRSDTGVGNFEIEFNYDQVQWETGDVSQGHNGLGGLSARAGFSNGTGTVGTMFELTGSGVNGAFLDDNLTTGLSNNSLDSEVVGRYRFASRDGLLSVNHAPVLNYIGPKTVIEHSTLTFTALATDTDNDLMTYSLGEAPAGASIDPTTGVVSWTPNESQRPGNYSFRIRVTDSGAPNLTDSEVITVTLVANQAPLAQGGVFDTVEDQPIGGTLSASDPDGNGQSLTYRIITNGTKGTVILTDPALGAFTYIPNRNAEGSDSFTFKVNDGWAESKTATVTIHVTVGNHTPVARSASYDTPGGISLRVATANGLIADVDGDELVPLLVEGPAHGTLTWDVGGWFTYTPAPDFNGVDTFLYQVGDGRASSVPALVTIRVGGRDGDFVGPRVVVLQRFGVHRQPTRLELSFDEGLDPARAADPTNYTVVNAGRDRKLGTRDDVVVALRSATYDAASGRVALRPVDRLYLYGRHEVRIMSSGGRAPTDLAGNFLDGDSDGQPGGNARLSFGKGILTRRAGRTTVRSRTLPHSTRHPFGTAGLESSHPLKIRSLARPSMSTSITPGSPKSGSDSGTTASPQRR